jgi:AAA15 family ATPase/GTPase
LNKARVFSLDLHEFRGIRRIENPPIKLAKFNVLIGRNNSGKTSLLEALALLPDPKQEMPLMRQTRTNLLTNYHGYQKDFFVYGYSGTATISYNAGSKTSNLFMESGGETYFETTDRTDAPEGLVYEVQDHAIRLQKPPISLSEVVTSYYTDDIHELMQSSITSEENWKTIEKRRAHNRVLKEVITPSVAEKFTEVLPHYISNRWILQARKEFPDGSSSFVRLSELGRGLQRAIVPLLFFEATDPSIALWDDIEAGMHPSLLENLLRWLSRKDWQIVISTHSIDVLSAVAKIRSNDAQVIMLSKSPDDLLSYKILSIDSFTDLIDSGQDPRGIVDLLGFR